MIRRCQEALEISQGNSGHIREIKAPGVGLCPSGEITAQPLIGQKARQFTGQAGIGPRGE